jgi:hypothetical protein
MEGHFLAGKQVLAIIRLNIIVQISKFRAPSIPSNGCLEAFVKTNSFIEKNSLVFDVLLENSEFTIIKNHHSFLLLSQ